MDFTTEAYRIEFDLLGMRCRLESTASGQAVLEFAVDSAVDTLSGVDETRSVTFLGLAENAGVSKLTFALESSVWQHKELVFELEPDAVLIYLRLEGQGQQITDLNYLFGHAALPSRSDLTRIYAPRFDWLAGEVTANVHENESLSCQQWLSPPPFCYAFLADQESIYCGIAARPGRHNFVSFDYRGTRGPSFCLTYEGHTRVQGEFVTPTLIVGFGAQDNHDAIDRYVQRLRDTGFLPREGTKEIPTWWSEPIFCGWGQMRYEYRKDHEGHENGSFINVTFYCTEQRYRNYVRVMEEHGVDPGTIIIDMGWAEEPALHRPSPDRWADLRAFVDEQHAFGRKVLLWYTPVVTAGLPLAACMTLAGRAVCPDPTAPLYREILAEEIRRMIAHEPECLNADGFKIDFTQNTPSENGRFTGYINSFWGLINEENEQYLYPRLDVRRELIHTYGDKWGVEILREYISLIYQNMKLHKAESMLITHTANPYFADVVDVLRLNDLDGNCQDVLEVMENRARIARACSQNWLLDTDNDLMVDRARWRAYIELQPQLGIPDTYYITAIANSQEKLEEDDYACLRRVWSDYRAQRRCKNE